MLLVNDFSAEVFPVRSLGPVIRDLSMQPNNIAALRSEMLVFVLEAVIARMDPDLLPGRTHPPYVCSNCRSASS